MVKNSLLNALGWSSRRAVGVALDGPRARVVALRGAKPPSVEDLPLDPEGLGPGIDVRRNAAGRATAPSGPAFVALSQQKVVVRFARLPSDDPAETRAMARMEALRRVPLLEDEALVGAAVVGPSAGGYSRAAMLVARRDDLAAMARQLEPLGLAIVGFFPKGYLWALALGKIVKAGRTVGVLREPGETTLAVLHDGAPVALRGLAHGAMDPAAYAAWIDGEIRSTLEGVEWPGDAPATPLTMVFHSESPDRSAVGAALEKALEFPVESTVGAVFPPGGVAGWAAEAGLSGPDGLIPREPFRGPDAVSRWAPTIALGLATAVAGLCLWGGFLFQLYRAETALTARWNGMKKEAIALEDIARRYRRVHRPAEPSQDWPSVVALFDRVVPPQVKLTGLDFERGQSVGLRGRAPSLGSAVATVAAIEKAKFFKAVELRSSVSRSDDTVEFQIVCTPGGRP